MASYTVHPTHHCLNPLEKLVHLKTFPSRSAPTTTTSRNAKGVEVVKNDVRVSIFAEIHGDSSRSKGRDPH
ncbi:LacI family transcriptional regulator [Sesbania bispinosa]|nr:LacI family transcriptional regulator [Sesbania bispinosa]